MQGLGALTANLKSPVQAQCIIKQFMHLNLDFCVRQQFTEKKMGCLLEIMFFVVKLLMRERASED